MSSDYISERIRQLVREQAKDRCGYCLSHQRYVLGPLEIEHIIPQALDGTNALENLWLACRLCNGYKAAQIDAIDPLSMQRIRLFNPRTQLWKEHFQWNATGDLIVGITPCGRATVVALQLNNVLAVMVRRAWISAGWHPPID